MLERLQGISPICWRGGYKLCYCLVLQENGLKLSNSWAGYHILLNPDYGAQVLWRFVNRAIDEVENHQVQISTAITCPASLHAYIQMATL